MLRSYRVLPRKRARGCTMRRHGEATSYTPQRKHVVATAYTDSDVPASRNTADAETVIAIASRGCVRRRRKHGIRHIASVNSAFIGGNARTCGRPAALRRTFLYSLRDYVCLCACVHAARGGPVLSTPHGMHTYSSVHRRDTRVHTLCAKSAG